MDKRKFKPISVLVPVGVLPLLEQAVREDGQEKSSTWIRNLIIRELKRKGLISLYDTDVVIQEAEWNGDRKEVSV